MTERKLWVVEINHRGDPGWRPVETRNTRSRAQRAAKAWRDPEIIRTRMRLYVPAEEQEK